MAFAPASSCSPTSFAASTLANSTDLCFSYCDCVSNPRCTYPVGASQRRELQSLYGAFNHLYSHMAALKAPLLNAEEYSLHSTEVKGQQQSKGWAKAMELVSIAI